MTNLTAAQLVQVETKVKEIYKKLYEKELDKTLERIKSLEDSVAKLESEKEELKKIVEEKKNNTEAPTWNQLVKEKTVLKQICNENVQEINRITKKEKNVIIHGIEVNVSENHDVTEVAKILKIVKKDLDIKDVKVTRLKTKKPNTIGPVLVELLDTAAKFSVLKGSKNLRGIDEFKKIYINPDLTTLEAALNKKLRDEFKSKNSKLPHGSENRKYGMHTFQGDENESKYFYGIRNSQITRIKVEEANENL